MILPVANRNLLIFLDLPDYRKMTKGAWWKMLSIMRKRTKKGVMMQKSSMLLMQPVMKLKKMLANFAGKLADELKKRIEASLRETKGAFVKKVSRWQQNELKH